MGNNNKKKSEQLGMNHSTAQHRLRKHVLFHLLQQLGQDICFQCGERIEHVDQLSMEHKVPWFSASPDLFWDLDNIAFSHLSCNIKAGRRPTKGRRKHPSIDAYIKGCRCEECREIQKLRMRKYRNKLKQ